MESSVINIVLRFPSRIVPPKCVFEISGISMTTGCLQSGAISVVFASCHSSTCRANSMLISMGAVQIKYQSQPLVIPDKFPSKAPAFLSPIVQRQFFLQCLETRIHQARECLAQNTILSKLHGISLDLHRAVIFPSDWPQRTAISHEHSCSKAKAYVKN